MATHAPSIKGSAVSALVEDVRALRDGGRLSAEELEARLAPEDLALLESKIQPALWYPITSYRRLSELLLELEGHGDLEYIADRGARAAERLWESGLYVQFQHGEEQVRDKGALSERDSRLLTTLSGAIFNFSRWQFRLVDGGGEITVTEARDLPDVSVHAARGFLAYVVSRLRGFETHVRVERPEPDTVVFRYALA